ncbi:hypothetical protein [Amaricoccus sp. W119]
MRPAPEGAGVGVTAATDLAPIVELPMGLLLSIEATAIYRG